MVPRTTAWLAGDVPRVAGSTLVAVLLAVSLTLLAVSLGVASAGAAPGPGDSPAETTETGDVPTDSVGDAENETGDVVDEASNATGDGPDESNESEDVGPVTPSNWSDNGETENGSTGDEDEGDGAPWTWEWSENWSEDGEPMTENESGWPDEWLGPREDDGANERMAAGGPSGDGDGPDGSAGDSDGDSGPVEALAEAIPTGGDDSGSGLSVVGGVGVVLAVGVSRRVGTAVSLGVSLPHPAASQSLQTVSHWFDRRLPRLPPIVPGQYSRRDDSDPLAHTRRSELAAVVAENPGVPLATLSDRLDVPRSTVRYHVRVLEEEDELETANVLGRRRLFPAGANTELVAALADEGTRRIVTALARIQPATGSRIADETGKANSTVSYHLDRLAAASVVERDRDGKYVYNRLAPEAEELLATVDVPVAVEEVPQ